VFAAVENPGFDVYGGCCSDEHYPNASGELNTGGVGNLGNSGV
jgi:hypothetical protein